MTKQPIKKGADKEVVPPITSVCTPTRNRTESLQRFLKSYAQSARNCGRKIRLVVADQSDDQRTRNANLQLLENTKKEFGIACFYAGTEEKEQFARQLAQHAGVSSELVRFAICHEENRPAAYGANRNALFLTSLDELIVHASDDTLCQFAKTQDPRDALVLSSDLNPQELYNLTEDEHASYQDKFDFEDVFSLQEQLLGRSLSSCIEQHSSEQIVDLESCKLSFWRKLEPRRVTVTCAGLVGDSNMGTPYWALLGHGKSRESLVRSEEDYRFSINRQLVSRGVRGVTICERGWKGAPCEGFDNRQVLAPFPPYQRGEDVIFGLLTEFSSSGYIGYLPFMVRHNRPSRHSYQTEDLIEFATRSCSYTVMKMLLEDSKVQNFFDASANLDAIGKILEEFGSLAQPEFDEMIRLKLYDRWSKQIEVIEDSLSRHKRQPHFWADDIVRCLDAMKEAVQRPTVALGSDLADTKIGSGASVLQDYITKFGSLIRAWPDLRKASRDLHLRGVGLARPL